MNRKLIVLLVLLLLIPGCGIGCIGVVGVGAYVLTRTTDSPSPEIVPAGDEERVWHALADFIEDHPERFADTDRVYKIGEELKTLGKVSSTSRLSEYAARMQPITSENRAAVVQDVRGN